MNKRNLLILLCSMMLLIIGVPMQVMAEAEDEITYVVTLYNERDGLPTGEANTVLQTEDGHIWIGSYGGLLRYDGSSFRNYSMEQAITSNSIRSLFQDSKGRLWIGTNDAGVVMMEKDVFTQIASPADNSFLCIRDFVEDEAGTIYVASNSGIAKIESNALLPIEVEEVKNQVVYSMAIDNHGRLWSGIDGGKCVIIKDDKLVDIFTGDRLQEGISIYSIDADDAGNVVMGTSRNMVVVVNFPTESLEKKDVSYKIYNTGNVTLHNDVNALNGYILVSGIDGFALIDSAGRVVEFGEKDHALSINTAIADYENNIWLASSAYGVIRYSQGCISSPNSKAKLDDVTINAIAYGQGYWYLGGNTGLLIYDRSWKPVKNELTKKYANVRIRHIMVDSMGYVWLAAYIDDYPIVCYKPLTEEIVVYNDTNGLLGNKGRVVAEMSDGRIVAGTQFGVTILEQGKVTKTYGQQEGMGNTNVLCITEAHDGGILVGSDGAGIYLIEDDKITNHGFDAGLGEGTVLRMLKNADGDGYFVSAGSSVYYWQADGSFRKLTNFAKDAGSIFDLYDRDGRLWILQNNGILAMDKEELLSGEETDTIHYSFDHGLSGSLNANTWNYLGWDGKLYMATRNGISVFGFEGVQNSTPKLCISRAIVDGKVYEHPTTLELERGAQRVTIEYAVLSYTDTAELRITTFLEGFDKEPTIMTQKSGSVSYTNLPGGKYTFSVSVDCLENGKFVANSLPIEKQKKLKEYLVFWILTGASAFLISGLIIFLLVRGRVRRLQRRQQEYKSIVEQSMRTFAKSIDVKDAYTQGHSLRVAHYSRELAKRMGMSDREQENIYYIALLHDIGKIGVPDSILNKKGRLNEEEMQIIRRHVDNGAEILKDFTALEGLADGALYHHERFDGKGYGKGIAGLEIPQVARIIGVADAYDAMSSDRCYRKALSKEVIEEELEKCSGTQFDPQVVPFMLSMIEEEIVPIEV